MEVSVAIITHRAKEHLPHCLPPLFASPLKPRVLVVNSSSEDGTVELAEKMGAETLVIPRRRFNHGATRELAREHLKGEIVVMLTPDAYPVRSGFLEQLVAPIASGRAAVSYGRQLPREKAGFLEAFARDFNYPKESHLRGIKDREKWGVYTFFCSNSAAAWSQRALDAVGGFTPTLLAEDSLAVAKLLLAGHRIAYVAEATCYHSHGYSLAQEFYRHFDTGLVRRSHAELFAQAGSDHARGSLYVRKLFGKLLSERPALLPYALLQVMAKWGGYQLGRASGRAPLWWKRLFSSQQFYWESDFVGGGRF